MSEPNIKLSVRLTQDPKTAKLNCAHCKIDHDVEQYIFDKYTEKAREFGVDVGKVWWCGRCYLVYMGSPALRCDCPEHDVPPFPEQET